MLRLRLSESERRYLAKEAAALEISISDYVRRRLFEVAPRLNDLNQPIRTVEKFGQEVEGV